MSALTDLFTALANKIRSKTGGSATYTPPQMVNAIDDVYDAGVAAGTPTLTGNATASDVMSGKTFYNNSTTKQTGTYVAPTITSIAPSDSSPVSMSANSNYKPTTAGYAIKNSPTSLTPSNTSPPSIANGTIYKGGGSGYAISSYTSISSSELTNGVYFTSGFKKMPSSGYAYASQPTLKETTLWTNSSPTSNFAAQTITLSQDIDNYDYLKIAYRLSTSASTELSLIISVQDFKNTADANGKGVITLNSKSSNVIYARLIYYASDTSVFATVAYKIGSSGNSQAYSIPTKISGLKY